MEEFCWHLDENISFYFVRNRSLCVAKSPKYVIIGEINALGR
jgi:hypothetical protein